MMAETETETLTRMANQIAGFFTPYGEAEAVKEVAAHINAFWEPRMRRALLAHLDQGGAGLNPPVIAAAGLIRRPA
jgi:formate dehydrogenase subunit delta